MQISLRLKLITVSDQSHDLYSLTFLFTLRQHIYIYSDLYCTSSSFTTTDINHLFFSRISFPAKKNLLNIHNILFLPYLSVDSSKVINLASYTLPIPQTRSSFYLHYNCPNEIFHLCWKFVQSSQKRGLSVTWTPK